MSRLPLLIKGCRVLLHARCKSNFAKRSPNVRIISNLEFKPEFKPSLRPAVVAPPEARGAPASLPPELARADIHRSACVSVPLSLRRRRQAELLPPELADAPGRRLAALPPTAAPLPLQLPPSLLPRCLTPLRRGRRSPKGLDEDEVVTFLCSLNFTPC